MIDHFCENKFEYVIPSLFEYEGDSNLDENTFKLIDLDSNQMMQIRSDITAQLGRIYEADQGKIAKYCYSGDVFYRKSKNFASLRKFTQLGIEYIEKPSLERDLEVISVTLSALDKLEIKSDYALVIAFPKLFYKICELLKFSKDDIEILNQYLIDKNYSAISSGKFKNFADFLFPSEDYNITDFGFGFEDSSEIIAQISGLIAEIKAKFPNIKVILDPFDYKQFSYHTDFVFSIISYESKKTIAKGGSYCMEGLYDAIGSSFYIEELIPLN